MEKRASEYFGSKFRKCKQRIRLAFAGVVLGTVCSIGGVMLNGGKFLARDSGKSFVEKRVSDSLVLGGGLLTASSMVGVLLCTAKDDKLKKERRELDRQMIKADIYSREFDRREEMLSGGNKYGGVRDLYKCN